jgi:hypothetical protein
VRRTDKAYRRKVLNCLVFAVEEVAMPDLRKIFADLDDAESREDILRKTLKQLALIPGDVGHDAQKALAEAECV